MLINILIFILTIYDINNLIRLMRYYFLDILITRLIKFIIDNDII